MKNRDSELGLIYEQQLLQEVKLQDVRRLIKVGLRKGLSLFDIIALNLPEFIAIVGIFSSLGTMQHVYNVYKEHPEVLQQHKELTDKIVHELESNIKHIKQLW